MSDNLTFFVDNNAKLILKQLSEITDEDCVEFYESIGFPNLHRKAPDKQLKEWGHDEEAIKKIKIDCVKDCITFIWQDFPLFLSDFLRAKGYDIPNYLLGGKTLQKCGLAIYEN